MADAGVNAGISLIRPRSCCWTKTSLLLAVVGRSSHHSQTCLDACLPGESTSCQADSQTLSITPDVSRLGYRVMVGPGQQRGERGSVSLWSAAVFLSVGAAMLQVLVAGRFALGSAHLFSSRPVASCQAPGKLRAQG